MPVNSFEYYPMTWKPDKKRLQAPLYLSLATLLETDIARGYLSAGTQLPPQRELADFLDINLSTVTRAFKICERKGLIYAVIGKGTFVAPNKVTPLGLLKNRSLIPFGNLRPYRQLNSIVSDAAGRLLQRQSVDKLLRGNTVADGGRFKETAQYWLKKYFLNVSEKNIFLTYGTQNALVLLFLTVFQAGDKIAVDSFTYINFIALAHRFKIELVPLLSDNEGIRPDDLLKKCGQCRIKGIYLIPVSNNPTGVTLSPERRAALVEIIVKYRLLLIEDDTYAFTGGSPLPPLVTLIPENTVYVHGLSKALFTGLRVAYMVVPDRFIKEILLAFNSINVHIPPFNAEIADELILSGDAEEIIKRKNELSKERNALYYTFFPEYTSDNPHALFQWIPLPEGRSGYEFERLAGEHGLEVLCAERFFVGGMIKQSALRVAVCSPDSVEELEKGFNILKYLFNSVLA